MRLSRLPRLLGRLALAASLGAASQSVWSSSPVAYYVDAAFPLNAAEIGGAQLDALEVLLCRFGSTQLETAVVIGHAAADERNPELIARRRAERVGEWLMANAGWTAAQIYTEGKAAKQPVATNTTSLGRAKNRRVEIELVRASNRGAPLRQDCRPVWQDQLFSLSGESAMVMARALVRSGRVSADAPLSAALQARRLDLFEALASQGAGLKLTPVQHEGVARRALQSGQIDYFRHWIKTPDFAARRGELEELFLATCESRGSEGELAKLVAELHGEGLAIGDEKALACAVWRKSPVLAEAYLNAGAARFMTPQVVVDAGRAPAVLARLLVRGADPRARTAIGTMLFHTMRLDTTADVRRLVDLGLDINAQGRTFPSNPETTPLREALSYASVEVLDAMRQAGARLEGAGPLEEFRGNPDAQLWLLRHGSPVTDAGRTVVQIAAQDKGAVQVLAALRERGVDVGAQNASGQSALGIAIERYRPDVVRFLVDAGVDTQGIVTYRGRTPKSALEVAESLSVMAHPVSISGMPAPEPFFSPDLQQRKDLIIEILQSTKRSDATL